MAAVRKPANNDSKNNSLNCADAKSYLCQAASKNDANLYVYSSIWIITCYRVLMCLTEYG